MQSARAACTLIAWITALTVKRTCSLNRALYEKVRWSWSASWGAPKISQEELNEWIRKDREREIQARVDWTGLKPRWLAHRRVNGHVNACTRNIIGFDCDAAPLLVWGLFSHSS